MRRWMWATVALLLLTACKMGPDYTRPANPGGEPWRVAPATAESIANVPWWDLLQDDVLQTLVRVSLEENKDLKFAVASVEEFQARLLIARTDFIPQASVGANAPAFGHLNGNGARAAGLATPQTYYLQGNLSWEMDIWGRVRRANEAALADLLSREENQRAVIVGLVGSVAEAYFNLRALDLQIDITKRTLKAWEESVRISRMRYEHGDVPRLDLDRFEAERANAASTLAALQEQVVQRENQISVLLGRRPMPISRGLLLTEQVQPPSVPPGLPSDLLQRRPDVLQAEQQLAAATARIGVARAERFPTISLTGVLGTASPQLSSLFGPGRSFGAAGGSLLGPLLNAQTLGFEEKAAVAQAKQAAAFYEQTILVAFREVEDALIAIQQSREQREAQEQQVAALQDAYKLADMRYQGGRATYLDVLTAQRTLFDAELQLADTRRKQLVSVVQLYKALGGGWSPTGYPVAGGKASAVSMPQGGK